MPNTKPIIHESELNFISKCVLDYPNLETGGDFFGFWTRDGLPVVQYVIGPGRKTTRTQTSFYQDIEYLRKCGRFLNDKFGLEHIGGWHSHHKMALAYPSGGDVNTMRNMFRDTDYDRFLISISNIDDNSKVKINAFLFARNNSKDYSQSDWEILNGISPIRDMLMRTEVDLFIMPGENDNSSFEVDKVQTQPQTNTNEKVELSENSFFSTSDGRKFLKKEFDKIKSHSDCSNVEIVQNDDKTIGICFLYLGKEVEIRYPNDFSEKNPTPIIIEKENNKEIKQHVVEIKHSRFYILSPFNIIKECKRLIFGVKMSANDEKDSGENKNIPIE